MMQPQPMIVVHDVASCSQWFQDVLGLRSGHGGDAYEMLMDGDVLVAQLHHWDTHEHPFLGDANDPSRGNGVLLWFATDDFDGLMGRVEKAKAKVLDGPLYNPNGRQDEVWLEGPEGYRVVVACPRELVVGKGRPRPVPGELSAEARAVRAPIRPEDEIEADYSRVHRELGRARAARTVRISRRETS